MRWLPAAPETLAEIPPDASGYYAIRDKATKRAVYVGESHTGRLRKTLARHFQRWTGPGRGKKRQATSGTRFKSTLDLRGKTAKTHLIRPNHQWPGQPERLERKPC